MSPTTPPFWALIAISLLTCNALAQGAPYDLFVNVQQKEDQKFLTQASFRLPLKHCQAWGYLTDYESSAAIPGVLSSKSTRLSERRTRVKLVIEEQVLFLRVRMDSVIDFVELDNHGTDFVQVSGDAKSFYGSWRIEPSDSGTLFRYQSVFQPDSALPMVFIKYFLDRRLRNSFAAIAQIGASKLDTNCN